MRPIRPYSYLEAREEQAINSYYYEFTARDRIKSWHAVAEQSRRARSMKAWKRTRQGPTRLRPNPRFNLPAASLFDALTSGVLRQRS